ncbi:hypothetical protein VNO77_41906 [Canavalia gladiata]|uniref:Uncharacterized protein n=1 Tax=Canavalia gladiata TaxID=3824 RepID=A0AAN9K358_CANGL
MVKLGISLRKRLHFRQDSSFNSLPLGRGFSTRILSLSNKHRDVKSCLVEFKLSTGNLVDLGGCVSVGLNVIDLLMIPWTFNKEKILANKETSSRDFPSLSWDIN